MWLENIAAVAAAIWQLRTNSSLYCGERTLKRVETANVNIGAKTERQSLFRYAQISKFVSGVNNMKT